jgi:hypothetical protein
VNAAKGFGDSREPCEFGHDPFVLRKRGTGRG